MRFQTQSGIDQWAFVLARNPDAVLNPNLNGATPSGSTPIVPKELYISEELTRGYDLDGRKKTSVISMGNALARAGILKLKPVRIPRRYQSVLGPRYTEYHALPVGVRNKERWSNSKNPKSGRCSMSAS